jgi:hypothetical protein
MLGYIFIIMISMMSLEYAEQKASGDLTINWCNTRTNIIIKDILKNDEDAFILMFDDFNYRSILEQVLLSENNPHLNIIYESDKRIDYKILNILYEGCTRKDGETIVFKPPKIYVNTPLNINPKFSQYMITMKTFE